MFYMYIKVKVSYLFLSSAMYDVCMSCVHITVVPGTRYKYFFIYFHFHIHFNFKLFFNTELNS